MKKAFSRFGLSFGLFALIAACIFCFSSYAPAPVSGGCTPEGAYYDSSYASPLFYGKLDTVGASGTDTFKVSLACKPTSITYIVDAFSAGGATTTNFVVALYGSANNGHSYQSLQTFTLTPANTYSVTGTGFSGISMNYTNVPASCQYIVNGSFGGNPETNYMWVCTNTAASTRSWLGSMLVR